MPYEVLAKIEVPEVVDEYRGNPVHGENPTVLNVGEVHSKADLKSMGLSEDTLEEFVKNDTLKEA